MGEIQQIRDFRAPTAIGGLYENLLAALGSEEFGTTARESVMSVTVGTRRIFLFEAQGRERFDLYYFAGEPGLEDFLPVYRKHYLSVDPLHDAFRATPKRSDMALLRIRPCDIPHGYRRRCFDEPGIVERLSIVQRGADSWRVMNVSRHESEGLFTDCEMNSLIGLATIVLPMLPLSRADAARPRHLTIQQLEERFACRYGELTLRERQVCARAVIGMTVEATSLDLGIAKTSVQTYRQRAYHRLNISSSYELSSLVTH